MDPISLETVSRWATVAGVVLSALAAIAITIAAYASSRVLAGTSAQTAQLRAESMRAIASAAAKASEAEQNARAALALAREMKAADTPSEGDSTRTSGSKPVSTEATVTTTRTPVTRLTADSDAPAFRSHQRSFTPGARQAMIGILRAAVAPPRVELSWVATDDSYARAKAITSALEEAGWTVTQTGSLLIQSDSVPTSMTTGMLSDAALLLRKAFDTAGVKLSIRLEPTVPPDRINLMIGNQD